MNKSDSGDPIDNLLRRSYDIDKYEEVNTDTDLLTDLETWLR